MGWTTADATAPWVRLPLRPLRVAKAHDLPNRRLLIAPGASGLRPREPLRGPGGSVAGDGTIEDGGGVVEERGGCAGGAGGGVARGEGGGGDGVVAEEEGMEFISHVEELVPGQWGVGGGCEVARRREG